MTRRSFEALVERGMARIPPQFRTRLKNVVFLVEDEPPRRGLLGLYQGRPLTERSVSDPFAMPDTITIYQGPHERTAEEDNIPIARLVEETVWHEVAHYFGLNEQQVLRAERRRALAGSKRARRLRGV